MKRSDSGFTLVELMIALAIVALLLSIAIPGYVEFIRRAHRAEAMNALARIAAAQERFLFVFGTYSASITAAAGPQPTSGLGLNDSTREEAGDTSFYELELELGPDALSYTLRAVPVGDQAKDSCGTYQLTHAGVRTAAKTTCW